MTTFRIPIIGWSFADDFFTSKTTHLAIAIVAAAWAGFTQHSMTLEQALIFTAGSLGVAFLRDTHSKGLNQLADVLFHELHDFGYQIPDEADGGEVPESVAPVVAVPTPGPTVAAVKPTLDAAAIALEVAKILAIRLPNPMEAEESGTAMPRS